MRVLPWQMLPYFESGGAGTLEYFLVRYHRDHGCFKVLNWSHIWLFSWQRWCAWWKVHASAGMHGVEGNRPAPPTKLALVGRTMVALFAGADKSGARNNMWHAFSHGGLHVSPLIASDNRLSHSARARSAISLHGWGTRSLWSRGLCRPREELVESGI